MDVIPHEVEVSIDELVVDGLPRVMPGPALEAEAIGEAIRASLAGFLRAGGWAPTAREAARDAGRGEVPAPNEITPEWLGAAVAGAIYAELGG